MAILNLGTGYMYGYTLRGRIALWSDQSAQTASSEVCIVQIVNVYNTETLHPIQESAQTA